jgi:F-type H+-transporting ATPase subunit a
MASPILHIKDSYYFEIPKFMWRCDYRSKSEFPAVWIKNDPQYRDFEAGKLLGELKSISGLAMPPDEELLAGYRHWRDADHANFGRPFHAYLESKADWLKSRLEDASFREQWQAITRRVTGAETVEAFRKDDSISWSADRIQGYNRELSGKILIPQPFGELRNFYERESGFCISKFMIVEVVVFLLLTVVFSRIAQKIATGEAPRGRLWNLLEAMLLFVRDEIARKAIHDHHDHDHHAHDHHGHEHHDHDHHGHEHHGHEHQGDRPLIRPHAADRFVPLLWTFFFFILGCNLMGMLPWVGAPTGTFSVTVALAIGTISCSVVFGMLQFGFIGFWLNQLPTMDLPIALAVVLKPGIFFIEVLGFCIKHGVLAIRLLANMVAGHLVLLAIMEMAFGHEGARSSLWPLTAVLSVVGATLFSCLELFVAFLQAYVFTLLSALFIGAATSRH